MATEERELDFEQMGNEEFERQLFEFAESFIDACLDKVREMINTEATTSSSFNVSALGISKEDSAKRGQAVFDAFMGMGEKIRGEDIKRKDKRLQCEKCKNSTLRPNLQAIRTDGNGARLIVPVRCEICKVEREMIYNLAGRK